MKDFLPAQEVIHLKAAHRIEKDRKRADRIKTILFLVKIKQIGEKFHEIRTISLSSLIPISEPLSVAPDMHTMKVLKFPGYDRFP